MMHEIKVFDGQSANGTSTLFSNFTGTTGRVHVYVSGDLGGGTINVEARLPDESAWVAVDGGEITGTGLFILESSYFVGRLNLTGATTPSVDAWVVAETAETKVSVLGV